jgi:hypothetical protein
MIMQTRFVVVPAVPLKKETFPRRHGFASVLGDGYDLYDTQEKIRLVVNFSTRAEAEYECSLRNHCLDMPEAGMAGAG